jgi:DNA-directed RNA polymerase subunit beta'
MTSPRACRVVELSRRQPKGKAPISEATGRVKIEDSDRLKRSSSPG